MYVLVSGSNQDEDSMQELYLFFLVWNKDPRVTMVVYFWTVGQSVVIFVVVFVVVNRWSSCSNCYSRCISHRRDEQKKKKENGAYCKLIFRLDSTEKKNLTFLNYWSSQNEEHIEHDAIVFDFYTCIITNQSNFMIKVKKYNLKK